MRLHSRISSGNFCFGTALVGQSDGAILFGRSSSVVFSFHYSVIDKQTNRRNWLSFSCRLLIFSNELTFVSTDDVKTFKP
jgi:hypothetical protein